MMPEGGCDVNPHLLLIADVGCGPNCRLDAVFQPALQKLFDGLARHCHRQALLMIVERLCQALLNILARLAIEALSFQPTVLIAEVDDADPAAIPPLVDRAFILTALALFSLVHDVSSFCKLSRPTPRTHERVPKEISCFQ